MKTFLKNNIKSDPETFKTNKKSIRIKMLKTINHEHQKKSSQKLICFWFVEVFTSVQSFAEKLSRCLKA